MIDHPNCRQFEQCSVCCMWVDPHAGSDHIPCPACPYRDDFLGRAASRLPETAKIASQTQPVEAAQIASPAR